MKTNNSLHSRGVPPGSLATEGTSATQNLEVTMSSNRITQSDVDNAQAVLTKALGYEKYKAQGRYGYIGIDVYDKEGICLKTYKTGLTKREAWECLNDIATGIYAATEKQTTTALDKYVDDIALMDEAQGDA